jgi:hypothetical protein
MLDGLIHHTGRHGSVRRCFPAPGLCKVMDDPGHLVHLFRTQPLELRNDFLH